MSSDFPSQDNGLVQYAGFEAIATPAGTDLSQTQAPRIIATSVILMILSAIAVLLRFAARKLSKAGLWWDDWTILAAMILAWGADICMIASTATGFGRHAAYYTDFLYRVEVVESYFKIFYAYETLYTFAVALCKYSILLFYSRIFTERPFRIALYIMHTLITLWLIAIQISVFAQCVPVSGLWQLSEAARCIDLKSFFVGAGIPNVLLNVIIVFLPVPMIWTLDIERKYRFALSGVFALGTFIIGVSIARVIVLANVNLVDITWNFVDAAVWTSVEPSIAVVSACLPILRSLWVWNRKRTQAKSTNTIQTRSRSPMQSSGAKHYPFQTDRKARNDSFTTPINELPADDQHWGVHTDIYSSSSLPSRSQSNKKLRYEDSDIKLYDLPIQKHDYPPEKSQPISKPHPLPKAGFTHSGKNQAAELYGS